MSIPKSSSVSWGTDYFFKPFSLNEEKGCIWTLSTNLSEGFKIAKCRGRGRILWAGEYAQLLSTNGDFGDHSHMHHEPIYSQSTDLFLDLTFFLYLQLSFSFEEFWKAETCASWTSQFWWWNLPMVSGKVDAEELLFLCCAFLPQWGAASVF